MSALNNPNVDREWVRAQVAKAPPLTDEQCRRVSALLFGSASPWTRSGSSRQPGFTKPATGATDPAS